jgi:hypothetical protein
LEEVVEGIYYQQQGLKENSYILLAAPGPARIYSHLICASGFSMKLQKHRQKNRTAVYALSNAALQKIESVLRSRDQAQALESEDEDEDVDTDHTDPNSESDEGSDSDS